MPSHHPATHYIPRAQQQPLQHSRTHGNTLQYTATDYNTLHTFLELNGSTLQRTATTHCNTLQHTTTHRNTLQQHTATHCKHCNTLQYTATHRNKPQHTAATLCSAGYSQPEKEVFYIGTAPRVLTVGTPSLIQVHGHDEDQNGQ